MLNLDLTVRQLKMNIYGGLPTSCSYQDPLFLAQTAVSMKMAPSSETLLGIANHLTNPALSPIPKRLQMPLDFNTLHGNTKDENGRTGDIVLRCLDDTRESSSSLDLSTLTFSPVITYTDQIRQNEKLNFHYNYPRLHQHLLSHHQQQQHINSKSLSQTPPSFVGNGIASLKALCESDESFLSKGGVLKKFKGRDNHDCCGDLKFGMKRILSDDFGKLRNEKENNFVLKSVPLSLRPIPIWPCDSPLYSALSQHRRDVYSTARNEAASLSAVHALQPPHYAFNSSIDALPGPYSVLSTDTCSSNQTKRKRSWSRAVFSNLQRKGLEKRFEVQKYVTKPDRRQLANMLGLTDAQVKVWFQNRRMKWRHAQQHGEKEKVTKQDKLDSKNVDLMDTESTNPDSLRKRSPKSNGNDDNNNDQIKDIMIEDRVDDDNDDDDLSCCGDSDYNCSVTMTTSESSISINNCSFRGEGDSGMDAVEPLNNQPDVDVIVSSHPRY